MVYKDGVNLNGVEPPTWYAIGVAEGVFRSRNSELVVTSLTDGVHPDAKNVHGRGFAVDIRTRDLAPNVAGYIVEDLGHLLFKLGYDIVLEKDHLHIEWDAKPQRDHWCLKAK